MIGLLLVILPYLAFLGLLVALGAATLAYFWPTVEWHLICWLQARRRARETRHLEPPKSLRLGVRWPR